ncbi:GtrA family protein [bacterium]|nr:GtrA family protein [bacterium]
MPETKPKPNTDHHPRTKATHEVARVGRFGIVGILNTLIDFGTLNLLTRLFGLSNLAANIPATTIAMLFSFFANRNFVFKAHTHDSQLKQALCFFAFTAFGLYVLQSSVIYFFEQVWVWPIGVGVHVAQTLGVTRLVDDQFIVTNGVKAVATVVSLSWNYLTYKRFVFKEYK